MQNHSTKVKTFPRPWKPRRLLRRPRENRTRSRRRPRMRFSPTAWAKLLFVRDRGSTEVGGFGITPTDDLLHVEDFRLMQQTCTAVSVAFDDTAVAEFFEEQVDLGRRPEQFARIGSTHIPATRRNLVRSTKRPSRGCLGLVTGRSCSFSRAAARPTAGCDFGLAQEADSTSRQSWTTGASLPLQTSVRGPKSTQAQ